MAARYISETMRASHHAADSHAPARRARPSTRIIAAASTVLGSVALFVVLVGIAIASYPGGNALDRRAEGHDMLRNFLCDLLPSVALDGSPNPIGALASPAGMLALSVGLAAFWWMLADGLATQPRIGSAMRAAGALTMLGLIAVPLTPSTSFAVLHAVAIFVACAPALVATGLSVIGLARAGRRAESLLGAAVLGVGAIDVALFAHHAASRGPVPLALPALQRVACVLLLAWLVLVSCRELAASRRSAAASNERAGRGHGCEQS